MRDRPPLRLSRLLSLDSHPSLPRPSVCGSLEPTTLLIKPVAWFSTCVFPSRGVVCAFSQQCSPYPTFFARRDRWPFSHFPLFSPTPFGLVSGRKNVPLFFRSLAAISLRIPWAITGTVSSKGTVYACSICSGEALFLPSLFHNFRHGIARGSSGIVRIWYTQKVSEHVPLLKSTTSHVVPLNSQH